MQLRLKILFAFPALFSAVAMNATPAGAAPAVAVFVFSAPAVLNVQVLAPVGVNNGSCTNPVPPPLPAVGPVTVGPVTVGVCNQVAGTYNFDTSAPPAGTNSACVGLATDVIGPTVAHGAEVHGVINVVEGTCRLQSNGNLGGSAVFGWGAWCGLSGGRGIASATVGFGPPVPPLPNPPFGTVAMNTTVDWLVSAGTVLPLVFGLRGGPAGIGAVQTTGPTPGPCGLASLAGNPAGASTFQVTGFALLAG